MAKTRIDGLDQLQRDLKKLDRNAKKLSGKHSVPLDELFTASFMRKYTKFRSIDALLEAGGFHASTDKEFDAIPQTELDAHIAKTTKFRNWDAMLDEAVDEYVSAQLGF